jgi:hypothetical protein
MGYLLVGRGAAFARVQRNGHEVGQHGQARGKRGSCRLCAQHGRQSVARAAGRARRDEIGVGLVQLVRSALKRRQIVAQSPGNSVFQRLFERFLAFFQEIPRLLELWKP